MKRWIHWHAPHRWRIPSDLSAWLTDTGSLTRRLQSHNQSSFSVALLGHRWAKPLVDECQCLNEPHSTFAYQREVRLMDGDIANVYARTVIPRTTYTAIQHRLNTLANRPLAELLFVDPLVQRSAIEVACLRPGDWLYEMALSEENSNPDKLWARRSIFYLGGKKLLVNEIFLPTLMGR